MAEDGCDEFKRNDTEAVVLKQQVAIAVDPNPARDLVIRRRHALDEQQDVWIVIPRVKFVM
jgi:hypothetical protein